MLALMLPLPSPASSPASYVASPATLSIGHHFGPNIWPCGPTITLHGRLTSPSDPLGITEIKITTEWHVNRAWQVGPRGLIFKSCHAAMKYARNHVEELGRAG